MPLSPAATTVQDLRSGGMYRITFKRPRSEQQMIAKFLASDGDNLVLSLRPVFGTQSLPVDDIVSMESVPDDTACVGPTRRATVRPGPNDRL